MGYQVRVISPHGELVILNICETEEQFRKLTVGDLEKKIVQHFDHPDGVRLVFQGQALQESYLLSQYGIQHLSTIQTAFILLGGGGGPEEKEDQKGNMGDRDHKNISMTHLADFQKECVIS